MIFYLAEPVDQGSLGKKSDLAAEMLNELGATIYRPSRAFQVAGRPTAGLQRINEAALAEADGVFALIRSDVPTLGVPAEITHALDAGKPVVLASDLEVSWVVAAWNESPNFRAVGLGSGQIRKGAEWLFNTWSELTLRDLERGPGAGEPGRVRSEALVLDVERRLVKIAEETINLVKERAALALDVPQRPEKIVFERVAPDAQLPERAYGTDAGFDLFVSKDTYIPSGATVYVPCGVAVDVPDGWWGCITGRSSTKHKRGLDVTLGVIDEGFAGELYAAVTNPHQHSIGIKKGDRLVQIVFIPAVGSEGAVWGKVREKPRGANGFGSSGTAVMHETKQADSGVDL